MNISAFRRWLVVVSCVPAVALAYPLKLNGKAQSKVTAHVVKTDVLEVTDDKGGWFSNLEMQQLGGWDTPYEVQARLRVVSTSGTFQVRIDEPLVIRNQSDAAQVFREPKVTMGNEGGEQKILSVDRSTLFQNPASSLPGENSVGFYTLAISAYPPEGDFRSTTGTYGGVLSMTFEPVTRKP
ncbi:hypothetical protein [Burkholderia sp. MSMB1835]|uniref:hypothetical protein n=1 Tax=Burkholderia sp. MSMB1835 TaxID=1637876 RepID=UPI00075F1C57|nr:hypothetical protein [Burkholderia sp. MSMB1835]KVL37826.1 hypothetical protein WS96_07615 [Burkholderia sp. MSMB1835]